jgi:hypothetical protein
MDQNDDMLRDEEEEEDVNSVDVREAEMWSQCYEKIPRMLQAEYSRLIGDFNMNTRIRIYKILDLYNWAFSPCELFLNVLIHAKASENIAAILDTLELQFEDSTGLYNMLCIFINIDYPKVREFIHEIPPENILRLMDVVSFTDKKDFELVFYFIQKLSVCELVTIMDRCNEPFAKQCRLCNAQRLASLENRLLNHQLKPDTV